MGSYNFSYTSATEVTVVHGLDDSNPFWVLYDADGNGFLPDPDSPTVIDANTLYFDFGSTPITGTGTVISILDIVAVGQAFSFTTIQACKDYLNITASGTDVDLAIQIGAITTDMQNYMDRLIVKTSHTDERHNGKGQDSITLDNYPVTVTGANAPVVRLDDVVVDADDYVVDAGSAIVQLKATSFPTSRWENIGVDYQSGYVTGVPADLNNATVKQVSYEWRYRGDRESISLASSTATGAYVDVYRQDRWASGVQDTMDRYRRVRI